MESRIKCAVPGCNGLSQLFRFPRKNSMLNKWTTAIKNPYVSKLTFRQIYRNRRVCVNHFTDACFDEDKSTGTHKILKEDAVPTLYLPGQPFQIKCVAHLDSSSIPAAFSNHFELAITKPFTKLLESEILNLISIDRYCILLYKIVPIQPEVRYSKKYDCIIGWQNADPETREIFAENALIFMVRSLYSNWKQLLSFVFCEKDIKPEVLEANIKHVLLTCKVLRLKVVATICEVNPLNIDTMTGLKLYAHANCLHDSDEIGYDTFTFEFNEIIILYDIQHLFTHIFNEFRDKNIVFAPDHVAKWTDVMDFMTEDYGFDSKKPTSSTTSFNFYRILMQLGKKMMEHPNEVYHSTGRLLNFFDLLYGSLSGKKYKLDPNESLKSVVTSETNHWVEWLKMIDVLDTMMFVDGPGDSLRILLNTVRGIIHLWRDVLVRHKFKSFTPNYVRLNALNNTIREIFADKPAAINFTPTEFVHAFYQTMISAPDDILQLCGYNKSILPAMFLKSFKKFAQIKSDFRELDSVFNESCRALITKSYFFSITYVPVLNFRNLTKTKRVQIRNDYGKKSLFNHLSRIICVHFSDYPCDGCESNIFGCDPHNLETLRHFSSNYTKGFNIVAYHFDRLLCSMYNQCDLFTRIVKQILDTGDLEFLNCEQHNLAHVFVEFCVNSMIFHWVRTVRLRLKGENKICPDTILRKACVIYLKKSKVKSSATYSIYTQQTWLQEILKLLECMMMLAVLCIS